VGAARDTAAGGGLTAAVPMPRTLVVNFNSPELNQLAAALHGAGELAALVRPYVNKARGWERALARMPLAGGLYASTFGRRVLPLPQLSGATLEAGLGSDLLAAAVGRLTLLAPAAREQIKSRLYMRVRRAVAGRAANVVAASAVPVVVGYEGFALPAFEALRAPPGGKTLAVLNYPVAHHRLRRRLRDEEIVRRSDFASSWPDFDDWPAGHEARLDREIERADLVLLGSSFARDSFLAAGVPADKLVLAPYGVDHAVFSPPRVPPDRSDPRTPFEAVFAGQLTQRKGIAELLEGWQRFVTHLPQGGARLSLIGTLVGDGHALAPYWTFGVRHLPHQTRPALAAQLRGAHVFVFPTLIEGMPLAVLEAMACGVPVVCTTHGPGDLVRDGIEGLIVPPRDAGAVAAALARLCADEPLRRRLAAAAAARARQFGWARYTQQVRAEIAARF
jgi:glycosyltransferase involved in cell wall biosynthesis